MEALGVPISPTPSRRGIEVKAHRVAAILSGRDPGELDVLHSCDNPPCCNPEHLRPGTNAQNVADRQARGRSVAPPRRVKLSPEQVADIRRRRDAGEGCRALAREYGVAHNTISKLTRGLTHV